MLKLLLIAIFVMLPGVLGNFESHWDHIRPRSSFGNLFNYLFPKTSFAKPIKKPTPSKAVDLCDDHPNTVFLEGKCLLLVKEPQNFENARHDCEKRLGGRLYRHNIENPFLFEYLFSFFPQYFDAIHEKVWTVFKTVQKADQLKTLAVVDTTNLDADVSTNPYFFKQTKGLLYPDYCVFFTHSEGFLRPESKPCDKTLLSYVCEFPSADKHFVQKLW